MKLVIQKKSRGYTLVELLLSISLIAIIAGSAFPITRNFLDRNEFDSAFRLAVNGIRTAQINSQTGKNDTNWGVSFQSGAIIVFSGTSYATRATSFDASSSISTKITITGASEIIFDKVTGNSSTAPTLTVAGNGYSKTITVNKKGLPIY